MINWFDVPSESLNKDLTLKNLKVSENGTYGESGVAYSSVEVNVNSDGGGGSSDFSTAEVTFICSNPTMADSSVNFNSTFYGNYENPEDGGFTEIATPETHFSGSETVKNIILYKGNALLSIGDLVDEIDSISGNIVLFGLGQYKITGNCTIYYTPVGEA